MWNQLNPSEWENEATNAYVTRDTLTRYAWAVVVIEHFISGPYPGTPDWTEHAVGEGVESSLTEAQWKADRAWAREEVRQDVYEYEDTLMAEQMEAAEAEAERRARFADVDGYGVAEHAMIDAGRGYLL